MNAIKNDLLKLLFKLIFYIAGIAVIAFGAYYGYEMIKIYTADSAAIGTVDFEGTETDAVFKYDFGKSVAFYPSGNNGIYVVEMTTDKTDFNGDKGKFALYLNDRPCDTVSVRAGLVQAKAVFEFYATDGTTAANLTLDISLSFYSDKTVVNVSTTSGAAALGYFVHMTETEGFVLTLEKEITIQEGFNE